MPGSNKFAESIIKGDNEIKFKTLAEDLERHRFEIAKTLLLRTENLSQCCHFCGEEECDEPGEPYWIGCDSCPRRYHHACVKRPSVDDSFICAACV